MHKILFSMFPHKHQAIEYLVAGVAGLGMASYLEGIFKILGYVLTAGLILRCYYGLYKDRLDSKIKEVDFKLKEHELKKVEREESIEETTI